MGRKQSQQYFQIGTTYYELSIWRQPRYPNLARPRMIKMTNRRSPCRRHWYEFLQSMPLHYKRKPRTWRTSRTLLRYLEEASTYQILCTTSFRPAKIVPYSSWWSSYSPPTCLEEARQQIVTRRLSCRNVVLGQSPVTPRHSSHQLVWWTTKHIDSTMIDLST